MLREAFSPIFAAMECSPFGATAGRKANRRRPAMPLYTPDERLRRDQTPWTLVQGVLAPLQFLVFLISLALIINYLATGSGLAEANASVWCKTGLLYTIMITGCIWEKIVFGQYLFAPSFYWEDFFSIFVLALHTAYIFLSANQMGGPELQIAVALGAYASYAINAGQFLMKLRAARRGAMPAYLHGEAA